VAKGFEGYGSFGSLSHNTIRLVPGPNQPVNPVWPGARFGFSGQPAPALVSPRVHPFWLFGEWVGAARLPTQLDADLLIAAECAVPSLLVLASCNALVLATWTL